MMQKLMRRGCKQVATAALWTHGVEAYSSRLHAGSDGSIVSKSHAMAVLLASGIAGEPNKLTDEQVGVLEQQYGPFDRCLPTGHSFGELSLADNKLARRNATILAAEPASLIRIDKALYRRTLYEMQVALASVNIAS